MNQQSMIYRKSAKGSQAIATRDHALTPKLRSMLILVNGKKSLEELAKLGGTLGDPQQLLSLLLEQGLIEHAAPAATATATATATAAAPARAGVPLPEAQRFAVRRLTDLLGPTAEDLCLRIEATRNAQDFMQAIKKAELVLREFGGPQLAASFAEEMQAHRPD